MPEVLVDYHEDAELFRAAIRFTAAKTGFSERLIEKDYFCTVALAYLSAGDKDLVFKGGTCLSKIHAEFYRLSEDLDFGISTPVKSTRSWRSRRVTGLKAHLAAIGDRIRSLRIASPFRGFNNSLQYSERLVYESAVTGQEESLKIEVSVREPIVEKAASLPARTLLLDPFRRSSAVNAVNIRVLTMREAYAEKFRAALTRRTPAIRDFFDLDHAFRLGNVDLANKTLLDLLSQKLSIPGTDPIDMAAEKLEALRRQLQTQLRPVLRSDDYARFDLDRAYSQVAEVASQLRAGKTNSC